MPVSIENLYCIAFMRILFCIAILLAVKASAQIPRNGSGQFEYAHEVTTNVGTVNQLKEKARRFFNQPFLIHWDSVSVTDKGAGNIVTGVGYINVRAKAHGLSAGKNIPVTLRLAIETTDKGYIYTVNGFAVTRKSAKLHFPLEEKPESVKPITYDQVLRATHDRISFVIGWMKRYMEDR